ncbi:MAG TPA: DNA primase [Lachnospiraceae bacterium]|nr:DNA primase [Lachnospiraceae bacterium]
MSWYTEEQIEEVRISNDIVNVIGSYIKLKRSGSSYTGLCPFHNEKTPSFSVNPARQIYKCFGCGASGSVITFVMEYENYTFQETMEALAERAGITLEKQSASTAYKEQQNIKMQLLEINRKAASYYYAKLKSQQGRTGYSYLLSRGLSDDTIRHFGLGYAGQGGGGLYSYLKHEGYNDDILKETGLFKMEERSVYDKFFNRIIFPIMDANSRVIGFGGRVMGDAKPKYLNSPETKLFDKSRNLFGLNYARLGKNKNIILCEGYMDVIALHQAGFTNAVASLGTAFTVQQAGIIKRYADEVLLTYDSDTAGRKAALRAIPMLREAGINARIVHMEPYKDPDEFIKEMGADVFRQRMDEAENSFYFEIGLARKEYEADDPEQNTKFYHAVAKKLLDFEDKVQRENYLEAVAAKYSLRRDDLKNLVVRYGNLMPVIQTEKSQKTAGRNIKTEDRGISYSYKLLLSIIIERPYLYNQIKNIIKAEDYFGEPYRQAAQMLYGQLESGEAVVPARIINHFTEADIQNTVADMFQTGFDADMDGMELEKALNDLVIRIKEYSIDKRTRELTDINELKGLIQEKKALQTPAKLHIYLKDG